jgi:hypothetical protein
MTARWGSGSPDEPHAFCRSQLKTSPGFGIFLDNKKKRAECNKGNGMKGWILGTILAGLMTPAATPVQAKVIQKACLSAPRDVNPRLCACIQAAANRTLTRRDQKLAASFFDDPDKAEEIRMSDRENHEAFWRRYKAFGALAASVCN